MLYALGHYRVLPAPVRPVGVGFTWVFKSHFDDHIRPHLLQYLEYVQADIGTPPDRKRAQALAEKFNIEIQILDDSGGWSSHRTLVDLDDLEEEYSTIENGKEYVFAKGKDREYFMTRQGSVTLLFNVPNVRQGRKGFRGVGLLTMLLVVLLILYLATRRLFSPLTTIQKSVKLFGEGDLEHLIKVKRRDELGELANSINSMASEIRQMLDAKRQLLLAISHELRTPLTRAKVALELLEDSSQKYQLVKDVNAMELLVEEILETERLSSSHSKLDKQEADLVQVIEEVIGRFDDQTGIETKLPDGSVQLQFDVARIKLLLKNLIDNALRHTPENFPIPLLSLAESEDAVEIKIEDHGTGITAEHLPHLTEPFYRADPARQRDTGGYGLGLYLCRMIANAHGGEIHLESEIGKGTTVFVSLPK